MFPSRFNRNWRYHKELRIWITKENSTQPSQKVHGGEQGRYAFWDPEVWEKGQKELSVVYSDLEEKNQPVFAQSPMQGVPVTVTPATVVAQQQQHTAAQPPTRAVNQAFQGLTMGAM